MFSRAFSAMRERSCASSFRSLACESALALSVAWVIAPRAYSSWTAMVRSALSMEILVKRVAASTVALVMSEMGLVVVAMGVPGCGALALRALRCIVRRNNSILGRRPPPCQALFGALHQPVSTAVQRAGKVV